MTFSSNNGGSLVRNLATQQIETVTFSDDQGFTEITITHGEDGVASVAVDNMVLIPVEPGDNDDDDEDDKDSEVCDKLFSFGCK